MFVEKSDKMIELMTMKLLIMNGWNGEDAIHVSQTSKVWNEFEFHYKFTLIFWILRLSELKKKLWKNNWAQNVNTFSNIAPGPSHHSIKRKAGNGFYIKLFISCIWCYISEPEILIV